jgi:hypothetical protein
MSSAAAAQKTTTTPPSTPQGSAGVPQKGNSPQANISPIQKDGKETSGAAFKAAFEIAKILSSLSKKDQFSAMQMAGIQAGMTVSSSFARVPPLLGINSPAANVPKGRSKPKAPAPTRKWGPKVKAQQSEIADLNKQISEKSAKLGNQLPETDPLLVQRARAFRDLKGLKSEESSPQ